MLHKNRNFWTLWTPPRSRWCEPHKSSTSPTLQLSRYCSSVALQDKKHWKKRQLRKRSPTQLLRKRLPKISKSRLWKIQNQSKKTKKKKQRNKSKSQNLSMNIDLDHIPSISVTSAIASVAHMYVKDIFNRRRCMITNEPTRCNRYRTISRAVSVKFHLIISLHMAIIHPTLSQPWCSEAGPLLTPCRLYHHVDHPSRAQTLSPQLPLNSPTSITRLNQALQNGQKWKEWGITSQNSASIRTMPLLTIHFLLTRWKFEQYQLSAD